MRSIWIVSAVLGIVCSPLQAQQALTVEKTADGYVVRTRQTFRDGTLAVSDERLPSVPGLLRDFVSAVKDTTPTRLRKDVVVRAYQELFPRATIDSLLIGYEQLAMNPSEDVRVAQAAIVAIADLGSSQSAHPVAGQTRRLIRIYGAGDAARRTAVLWEMGNASERPAAVAFLRGIATQPPGDESGRTVVTALRALALLGDDGAAALRELDRTAAVRDSEGRFALRAFARSGYRTRP